MTKVRGIQVAGWYELQCPDCYWNHTLCVEKGTDCIQCPHCHRWFAISELQMLRPYLGGFLKLAEQESERMDQWALMRAYETTDEN